MERTLLLKHRPPFNRARVWKGAPWWLKIQVTQDRLNLALVREEDEHGIGPLHSPFRYVLGSFVRCLYRPAYPDLPISHYPRGLFDPGVPDNLSTIFVKAKHLRIRMLKLSTTKQPSGFTQSSWVKFQDPQRAIDLHGKRPQEPLPHRGCKRTP
jgi:hypothetical protein